MTKGILIQSLVTGILAAIAANIYNQIYFFATEVDYSSIINPGSLIGLNLAVSLFAGLIYWLITALFKTWGGIIFNFIFSICSFAQLISNHPVEIGIGPMSFNPKIIKKNKIRKELKKEHLEKLK